jgi:hypothetical protein
VIYHDCGIDAFFFDRYLWFLFRFFGISTLIVLLLAPLTFFLVDKISRLTACQAGLYTVSVPFFALCTLFMFRGRQKGQLCHGLNPYEVLVGNQRLSTMLSHMIPTIDSYRDYRTATRGDYIYSLYGS